MKSVRMMLICYGDRFERGLYLADDFAGIAYWRDWRSTPWTIEDSDESIYHSIKLGDKFHWGL